MKTLGSVACSCMRTRSPSSAPPVYGEVGSTASTAARSSSRPGHPHELGSERGLAHPGRARQADRGGATRARVDARGQASRLRRAVLDGEIARATARRSPASTPATSSSTSIEAQPTRGGLGACVACGAAARPGSPASASRSERQYARCRDERGVVAVGHARGAPSRGSTCSRWSRCEQARRPLAGPPAHRAPGRAAVAADARGGRELRGRDAVATDLARERRRGAIAARGAERAHRDRDEHQQRQPLHRGRQRHHEQVLGAGPRLRREQVKERRVPQEVAEHGERARARAATESRCRGGVRRTPRDDHARSPCPTSPVYSTWQ